MSREEKRKAREVEEEKRRAAENKRREEDELKLSNANDGKYQKEPCLAEKKLMEQKYIVRNEKEQMLRELEDNRLRAEREDKRRLRIEELAMAKVGF